MLLLVEMNCKYALYLFSPLLTKICLEYVNKGYYLLLFIIIVIIIVIIIIIIIIG